MSVQVFHIHKDRVIYGKIPIRLIEIRKLIMNKKILILSLILGTALAFIGCDENNKPNKNISKQLREGKPNQENVRLAKQFFEEGNYKKSLTYDLKQLKEDLLFYKEQSAEISLDYNNIGLDYDELEEYDNALKYYRKAMTIDNIVLDLNSSERATTYYNVGSTYDAKSDHSNALKYYFKALEIDKALFGEYHENILSGYLDIAKVYAKTEKYPSALTYYEKALKVQEEVFGKDDPDTVVIQRTIEGIKKKIK